MNVCDCFENKENFERMIDDFFKYLCENEFEIYNEFSFQHELGIFIRNKLRNEFKDGKEYRVEFERNAKKYFNINYSLLSNDIMKKEIDISIYKTDHSSQYAIELKFPLSGAYPEQMFNFIKDIRFMQELVNQKVFQRTYCITLVWARGRGRPFYEGNHEGLNRIDIYKYFRGRKTVLTGKIIKPTGKEKFLIDLGNKEYPFHWKDCEIINNNTSCLKYKYRKCKYYIVECK